VKPSLNAYIPAYPCSAARRFRTLSTLVITHVRRHAVRGCTYLSPRFLETERTNFDPPPTQIPRKLHTTYPFLIALDTPISEGRQVGVRPRQTRVRSGSDRPTTHGTTCGPWRLARTNYGAAQGAFRGTGCITMPGACVSRLRGQNSGSKV
jgi:hypothetical protein